MKNTNITRFLRFFLIPLIITVIITLILSLSLYGVTNQNFKTVYARNSENFSQAYAEIVSQHQDLTAHIYDDFYDKLRAASTTAINNRDLITNEYLQEIVLAQGIHILWWYTPTGEIIYDSSNEFIGWQAQPGDPIDQFMNSGLDEYEEGIRESTEGDIFYMVFYMRAEDGYFIQAVMDADFVIDYIEEHSYQNSIEHIVETNIHIDYAIVVDLNRDVVADTRPASFQQYDEDLYESSFDGETTSREFLMNGSIESILEVSTPIKINDDIIGVLVVGYSLEFYRDINFYLTMVILLVAIGTILVFSAMQINQVINPLIKLDNAIISFDVKSGDYTKPKKNISVFKNTFHALDSLSNRIKDSNIETEKLNHEIRALALTDYLTKMPNRMHLSNVIDSYINNDHNFAVLFVDLDDFKNYNDTKGHIFGDQLLVKVSEVLRKKNYQDLFISRYGGDEFVILLKYRDFKSVKILIDNLYRDFKDPIHIDQSDYPIDLSIGISVYPEHGHESSELIRKADIAMYQSKRKGKNIYTFYEDQMNAVIQEDARIISAIRKALREDGFKIVVQPQVDIRSGDIVSYESLVRFKHENIGPNKFIPIAEEANLIIDIGRVVIDKTIDLLANMKQANLPLKTIYVNFSSSQIEDASILEYIKLKLEHYNIEPHYLGIELTESTLIKNDMAAIKLLDKLRTYGIKIALDDFGSGQASLNYLMKYPLELVKLDRSFSRRYLNNDKLDIFNTIINLAGLLKFNVLAEGIEDEEQITMLKQTQCQYVQGYYYFRPMEIEALFRVHEDMKKDNQS